MGYDLRNAAILAVREKDVTSWKEMERWIEKHLAGGLRPQRLESTVNSIIEAYKADVAFEELAA